MFDWFWPTPRGQRAAPHVLRLAQFPAAIYAIGDLHGHLSLYDQLEHRIVADAQAVAGPKLILCLGDVVDRGPDTAALLDRLMRAAPLGFQRVVLMGNHEQMLLRFLRDPRPFDPWLANGGLETLASYGINPARIDSTRFNSTRIRAAVGARFDGLRRALKTRFPAEHLSFLNALPAGVEAGPFRFAHAGYDLSQRAEDQLLEQLIWGPHEMADRHHGPEVLVHGHVPVHQVCRTKNRIAVDVGSYRNKRLAAVRIVPGSLDHKVIMVDDRSTPLPIVGSQVRKVVPPFKQPPLTQPPFKQPLSKPTPRPVHKIPAHKIRAQKVERHEQVG